MGGIRIKHARPQVAVKEGRTKRIHRGTPALSPHMGIPDDLRRGIHSVSPLHNELSPPFRVSFSPSCPRLPSRASRRDEVDVARVRTGRKRESLQITLPGRPSLTHLEILTLRNTSAFPSCRPPRLSQFTFMWRTRYRAKFAGFAGPAR